jgi:type I restriction enzyme S subunit
MELKPGYKQTEVGVIPEDWDVKKLKDVAEIRSGIAKNSKAVVANPVEISYLRVANVQDGYLDLSDISTITLSRDDINRYTVMPGDVLMNEGGDLDKLGRGAIWGGDLSPIVHQNHVFVVRCKKGILPEFLNAWTSGSTSRRYFLVAGKQTTNLASINKSSLGGLPIALPCPSEQQKIAEALNELDSMIQSLNELTAKKRAIKQAAMQELLTGKRRLPGFKGEWEVKRLVDICTKIQDGTHFSPALGGGDYLYVTSRNIRKGFMDLRDVERISAAEHEKIYRRCDARRGDLLLTKDGANTGNAALVNIDEEFSLLSSVAMLRFDERRHDAAYFMYQILSAAGQAQIQEAMSGNAITRLTLAKIRDLQFQVPQVSEQVAISEMLHTIDHEISVATSKRTKASLLKQAMMQELLTGRIRLR